MKDAKIVRKQFESWINGECFFLSLDRDWEGYYKDTTVHIAWRSWCKAIDREDIKEA